MLRSQRRRLVFFTCSTFMLIACALVGLAFSLITRGSSAVAQSANRIVYGLTLMPSGFDPQINASAELGIPLRSVYDTLVYRDPASKQIVPGLAEKWEVSGDGLTYTFHLRQGVKFHDGTIFDAYAVAANLDRITDPETRSQKALYMLGPYEKYVVSDAQTIQIVLRTPYAPLLDSFCQVYLGIASPTALKAYDRDRYQLHQVGTGPYKMVEYVPGDHLLLRRNPDYTWGPSFYLPANPAPVDEIEFRFFTDPATRAPALETGAAQVMGEVAPTDALVLSRNSDIRLIPQPIPGLPLQFFFNTASAPTDQLEMRRTLITATNRVAIVDSVFQQFSPAAYGPLSASNPYYDARVKQFYPYDLDAARKAFNSLGYTDSNQDKMLDKEGKNLKLVMIVPSWGNAPQVAQKIQSQWRELGIELELRQVPNLAGLLEAVKSGDYNLVAFNDFGVDPGVLDNFYHTNAPNNFTKYANTNLDSLLTRGATSGVADERKTVYSSVQGAIMEQALILPIRDYVNLNGVSNRIGNLSYDAYGWFPLLVNITLNEPEATPRS
jgi:peptide/nickel transport system substrate-binding protein